MAFGSVRRARAALLPLAIVSAALGGTPSANAAPHLSPACASGGVGVTAYGATFQTNAQTQFIAEYNAQCGAGAASTTYNNPLGSGAGSGRCVNYTTNRAPDAGYGYTPYCGTDEALTSSQWASANTSGGGILHIPVAIGAVTVSFNTTGTGCTASPLVLTSKQISDVFSGAVTDWSGICTGASGAITRVVRNAGSGTTCAFKSYLAKRNPVPWAALNAQTGCGSTSWPVSVTTANGNSGVASAVNTTNGAVGYVELSETQKLSAGLPLYPNLKVANVKKVSDEAGSGSESPKSGTTANCSDNGAALPPHAASAGWDQVSLSDGVQGYPICTYTYMLLWTNTSAAVGANVTQGQVDAAVDLGLAAISATGQARLSAGFYAQIGNHARVIGQAGLASVL